MSDADIFINYRTSDEAGSAALIAEGLAAHFGAGRVFWDHGSIKAGERYPERLATAVGRCSVLIAVIGDRWLEARDARGRRRLENEDDWTRREIVEVLRRGAHLVPVLVAPRTAPLLRGELPDPLGDLAELQFRQFNPRTKESDIPTLCRDLDQLVPPGARPAPGDATAGRDGIRNSTEGGHGNPTVQARDVSGGIGSLISNPQGPVHSGQGDQHYTSHANHFTGEHTNYVAGSNHGNYVAGTNHGGMHQNSNSAGPAERQRAEEDDQR